MAIKQLESPLFKSVLADGSPNASGKVYVYAVNGNYLTAADQITTWTAKDKVTTHTHPIVLNAAGEAQIWFDNTVEIRVEDSNSSLLYTLVGVTTDDAPSVVGNFNLVTNGSFELDIGGSGSPDNWTLAAGTGGTISTDSTSGNQKNGTQSLKFTGTDSTGGGIATSDLFSVTAGTTLETGLYFKQENAATGTYSLVIEWYKFDGSASSTPTSTAWSSTSGASTTFALESNSTAVPSDSVSAKLRLSGLLVGGSDVIGSCWFDHIVAFGPEAVTLTGTQTLTNKTLTTPTISSPAINDTNGNEELTFSTIASAVNYLNISNSATSDYPSINIKGTGTNVGLLVTDNAGVTLCTLTPVASATQYINITSSTSTDNCLITTEGTNACGIQFEDKDSQRLLTLNDVPSAVNYIVIKPSVSLSGVEINSNGTDDNIDINITPKGAGTVVVSDLTPTDIHLNTSDVTFAGSLVAGAHDDLSLSTGLAFFPMIHTSHDDVYVGGHITDVGTGGASPRLGVTNADSSTQTYDVDFKTIGV